MLVKNTKAQLDAWQKLPAGRMKTICRDPAGHAQFRVIYKGVEYYSDIVEIEGASTVSMRAMTEHEKMFCVSTTSAVVLMR